MPKVFALFTAGAMASLALPGMSGFASELSVFVGVTSSDIYSSTFRTVTVFLAAVGLILTPIYLLSMLRQVFYGSAAPLTCTLGDAAPDAHHQENQGVVCFGTNCVLPEQASYDDAKPREVFIAVSFLLLIIAIGAYPKLATQVYDMKTVAVNGEVRQAYQQIAQTNPQIYAQGLLAPQIKETEIVPVLGVLK
jgi:NAD(P)H-quinone oxidoreductase subunit 4